MTMIPSGWGSSFSGNSVIQNIRNGSIQLFDGIKSTASKISEFIGGGIVFRDTLTTFCLGGALKWGISWLCPISACVPDVARGSVAVFLERTIDSYREQALKDEVARLNTKTKEQSEKIQTLVRQTNVFKVENKQFSWEKEQATSEKDRIAEQRNGLVTEKAEIAVERERFEDEKEALKKEKASLEVKNQKLSQEKAELVASKKLLEKGHIQALEELSEARRKQESAADYKELDQRLAECHKMYDKLQGQEGGSSTQLALETLVPKYEAHRDKLHKILQEAIQDLPETDLRRATLKGILRISQEEMEHVKAISQTMHLFKELREPLSQLFQAQAGAA